MSVVVSTWEDVFGGLNFKDGELLLEDKFVICRGQVTKVSFVNPFVRIYVNLLEWQSIQHPERGRIATNTRFIMVAYDQPIRVVDGGVEFVSTTNQRWRITPNLNQESPLFD